MWTRSICINVAHFDIHTYDTSTPLYIRVTPPPRSSVNSVGSSVPGYENIDIGFSFLSVSDPLALFTTYKMIFDNWQILCNRYMCMYII